MTRTVKTTIRETTKIALSRDELLNALRLIMPSCELPSNTIISVRVPGGGDWSDEDLTIHDEGACKYLSLEFTTTREVVL